MRALLLPLAAAPTLALAAVSFSDNSGTGIVESHRKVASDNLRSLAADPVLLDKAFKAAYGTVSPFSFDPDGPMFEGYAKFPGYGTEIRAVTLFKLDRQTWVLVSTSSNGQCPHDNGAQFLIHYLHFGDGRFSVVAGPENFYDGFECGDVDKWQVRYDLRPYPVLWIERSDAHQLVQGWWADGIGLAPGAPQIGIAEIALGYGEYTVAEYDATFYNGIPYCSRRGRLVAEPSKASFTVHFDGKGGATAHYVWRESQQKFVEDKSTSRLTSETCPPPPNDEGMN